MATTDLGIGGRFIDIDNARTVVADYFSVANRTSRTPYAYPAYDTLRTGSGANELNDGDLLAPAMLNVTVKIKGFYALQNARETLESALADTPVSVTLSEAVDDGTVSDRMRRFVGVLDDGNLPTVKLTTLTKVLHRKRSEFVPLHDSNVRACYVGAAPFPVQRDRTRSWADYFTAVAVAIDRDVRDQRTLLEGLREHAGVDVSLLRVLDVLAWRTGRP